MPTKNTPVAQIILDGLSPRGRQDLLAALAGLHTVASEDTPTGETMDYDGMDNFLRSVHPETKNAIQMLHRMTDTERNAPFERRMNLDDWAATLGLDAESLAKVKSTLATAQITHGLVSRMNPDNGNQQSPSTADALRAALEYDRPRQEYAQAADDALAEVGQGMQDRYGDKSLRETLRTAWRIKQGDQ